MKKHTNRQDLIEIIKGEKPGKDEFTIYKGDVKTYQYLRTNLKKTMSKQGLGGGNLTIALLSVTVLGLIAKTYVILADKACKNSQEDINETDAIQKLLRNYVNNWSYSDKKILEFWKRLRHKLVHKAYPKAVIVPEVADNYNKLQKKIIDEQQKPFSFDNADILWVNCDVLWYQTMIIRECVVKSLENMEFVEDKIIEALNFIKNG